MQRSYLLSCALWLEYVTLCWNVIGAAVMLTTAHKSGSVALAGFGFDSAIEIFASVVVVWQLKGVDNRRDRVALRLIGAAFIALASYVLVQSAWTLLARARPSPSPAGMIWLVATVSLMLFLAWGKSSVGRRLGNPILIAEARVTVIDATLAAVVLAGVGLNQGLGWWWADPFAGLLIVVYGFWEGGAAWRRGG